MPEPARVLVPIAEPIGGQMSAVGIRQFEIGRALAAHCPVTFAAASAHNDEGHGIPIAACRTRSEFRALLRRHDVLYTLGLNADRFLDVAASGIRVILDLYTPLAFEILDSWPEVPTPLLGRFHRRIVRWTNARLSRADLIICTNERQRDLWLGTLNTIGRLTAEETRRDPDCRGVIDVGPFDLPEHPPVAAGHPLRERLPRIGRDDFVLLWSSKILGWQDPVTLLRAMHLLRDEEPTVRLVFLGIGPIPAAGTHTWFDPTARWRSPRGSRIRRDAPRWRSAGRPPANSSATTCRLVASAMRSGTWSAAERPPPRAESTARRVADVETTDP